MTSKWYTPEFRAEAVRQVMERGYPVREGAQHLGVSTNSLYKWLKGVHKTPRLAAKEDLRAENARLKVELKRVEKERIRRRIYRTREEARADVFDYIEVFYNRIRRHSHLGQLSPIDFEQAALTKT
jgi:transposase-like protein